MSSDIIAAFDILHVSILLNHLEKYVGLSGSVIWLLKSYYNHQQQFVNIISFHSSSTLSSAVISYTVIGNPRGGWACSHPSLYLTATLKNYNAISLKTWILLSYFSWQRPAYFSIPRTYTLDWHTHPLFRQNELWVLLSWSFLMSKLRIICFIFSLLS